MDPKAWLDFVLGVLQALAWPAIVIIGIFVFKSELRRLLNNITSAKAWGIEANFLERELEDPKNSDETKDAVARIWAGFAAVSGKPAPTPVAEWLESKRKRGSQASTAVMESLEGAAYREQVKNAILRVSDGRISLGQEAATISGEVVVPDFTLYPEHGVGGCSVLVRSTPSDWEFLDDLKASPTPIGGLVVVSPSPFDAPSLMTVRWRSEDDDERLADALEAAELFDYVEDRGDHSP